MMSSLSKPRPHPRVLFQEEWCYRDYASPFGNVRLRRSSEQLLAGRAADVVDEPDVCRRAQHVWACGQHADAGVNRVCSCWFAFCPDWLKFVLLAFSLACIMFANQVTDTCPVGVSDLQVSLLTAEHKALASRAADAETLTTVEKKLGDRQSRFEGALMQVRIQNLFRD